MEIVSRILEHAGVGVTCDIYRHVATQELHEEHLRLVIIMPNLKHLLDELEELDVDPKQVKLPEPLYDDLVTQAEEVEEENEE